ncbi:MAG: hypothetical protein ABW025_05695 [Cellulomonas sp.]
MRLVPALAIGVSTLLLAGCAGSASGSAADDDKATTAVESPGKVKSGEAAEQAASADAATILESGFGQDGDYAWVTALVQNEGLVDEFATVTFNLYDEAGTLVASTDQVEGFTSEKGMTAIGTQVDTSGAVVAKVDAHLGVSEYGSDRDPVAQVAPVDGTVGVDGEWTFALQNGTTEDWTDLRVGIICRDAAGTVVGGGSAFPPLVAAGQPYLLSDSLIISTAATATCTAYPQVQISYE